MVRILQSQVHSVNGRWASGDDPSIVVDVGGFGDTFKDMFKKALERHLEPKPPVHLHRRYGIPSRTRNGLFFCGHEFIKFVPVNFPANVVRCLLNTIQDGSKAMVLVVFTASLENRAPRLIHLRFPEDDFIGNVETEHQFLGAPNAKAKSALCHGIVFFRLCPMKMVDFSFPL